VYLESNPLLCPNARAAHRCASKCYDRKGLVQEMREYRVSPRFARKQTSIIDQGTTRHPG